GLESYAYNVKQTVEDEKVKDKISEDEKKTVLDKVTETLGWLDTNQTAEKEEFDHHQKELEKVCQPIMMKLYQGGGPEGMAGMPGGMPGMPGGMPGMPGGMPGMPGGMPG
ncbi:Hsp70 family protein, partial [Salmonella sp. s51228]|uniref:Hsp70 family protein n=1 Tax=Salmonella sp. s51228 TaxID=3159652 RepID=UPI00397FB48F